MKNVAKPARSGSIGFSGKKKSSGPHPGNGNQEGGPNKKVKGNRIFGESAGRGGGGVIRRGNRHGFKRKKKTRGNKVHLKQIRIRIGCGEGKWFINAKKCLKKGSGKGPKSPVS